MENESSAKVMWQQATPQEQGNFYEFIIEQIIRGLCRPGDTVIDVGANYGAHTLTMIESVGVRGKVHAFEPNPTVCANLATWPQPQLCVHQVALSNRTGQAEFLVRERAGHSSLRLCPHKDGGIVTQRITVPVKRLDDFGMTSIRLIKVDIEGEEVNFLEGAAETLKNSQPVVLLEFDWREVFANNIEADVFFSWVSSLGFFIQGFFGEPVTRYDVTEWYLMLIPRSLDPDTTSSLVEVVHDAGLDFLQSHRSWDPYTKLRQAKFTEAVIPRAVKN